MSLYARYLNERHGIKCIENEYGFVTYAFPNPDECYAMDAYVIPEMRRKGVFKNLLSQVKKDAKQRGCKVLTTTLSFPGNDLQTSLLNIIGCGWKIAKSEKDLIWFAQEL